VPQVKPQVVPSHDVWLAPAGVGQAVQDVVPHEFTLLFRLHRPLQLWLPAGHWFMQAMTSSMHAPAQSFLPVGHAPPQVPFVQVAVPPVGAVQGEQDEPHDVTAVLLTHAPLQR
jgi:hypothetical protein